MEHEHPGFFRRLFLQQMPEFLWIGCSDARVPANEIVGLLPGDLFVHRNVANIVEHSDRNCLSVLQYGVTELRVRHIMVVGHYRCGGVRVALTSHQSDIIGEWLAPIRAVYHRHRAFFDTCPDESVRWDKLCELNVIEQARNLTRIPLVHEAWARGQELAVHGWIYSLTDGCLHDLQVTVTDPNDSEGIFTRALAAIL